MSGDDSIASETGTGGGETSDDFLRLVVGVTVTVIVAVLGAVVLSPAPAQAPPAPDAVDLDNSEYAVESVAVQEMPATGEIETDVSGEGTVVIDEAHLNEFDRGEIEPLLRAFREAGYEVRFHERGDLEEALSEADAYVVIDPGQRFDEEDREAVTEFTEDGGRVAVFGEPTRITVRSAGFGGVTVVADEREGDTLVGEYGLDFSSSYVYNQLENDGGFKNPVAVPAGPAEDVGSEVPVYTAAHVVRLENRSAVGSEAEPPGEVVLRYPEESRLGETDEGGEYAVAVQTDNLLAVGDATILRNDRYNVADNEDFLAYVVEFLAGETRSSVEETGDDGN